MQWGLKFKLNQLQTTSILNQMRLASVDIVQNIWPFYVTIIFKFSSLKNDWLNADMQVIVELARL